MISYTCKKTNLREHDYPYITGDTFRYFSDHIYDETDANFSPEKVKKGDIVFVNGYLLFNFFKEMHCKINSPYILLTHNSDFYSPGDFINYLSDPKIFAWFGVNPDAKHPKFTPIPLGIAYKRLRHYDISLFSKMNNIKKSILCYSSFSISTNYNVRKVVENYFSDKKFVFKSGICSPIEYLSFCAKSKFIISPPGRGQDCFRIWESFYLDTIPIVQTSILDEMYMDLPILIVDRWEEITKDFLDKEYLRIKSGDKFYNKDKFFFPYWWDRIKFAQSKCRI
jgi:hypothetical protein